MGKNWCISHTIGQITSELNLCIITVVVGFVMSSSVIIASVSCDVYRVKRVVSCRSGTRITVF